MNKIIELIKKYKIQSIIIGCLVLVGIVFLIKESIANPNSEYLRNQTQDGLSFENASLVYKNGVTTFTVEVYNESGDIYSLKNISINFKAANNDTITLIGYIGENLEKDEAKLITASIDEDLSSSIDLEYVINK